MISKLLVWFIAFSIIALYGCSAASKSYKERTLDDIYTILTDEEYQVLESLNTNEEIDSFLEEFWAKTDSISGLKNLEFKSEYLERLAYANAHFPDRRGWGRSDRKRIYLIYGPPTYIEREEFVSSPLTELTIIKSVEIWFYMTPGKNDAFPSRVDNIHRGERKFIFGDTKGSGFYKLLYSSENKEDIDVRMFNQN